MGGCTHDAVAILSVLLGVTYLLFSPSLCTYAEKLYCVSSRPFLVSSPSPPPLLSYVYTCVEVHLFGNNVFHSISFNFSLLKAAQHGVWVYNTGRNMENMSSLHSNTHTDTDSRTGRWCVQKVLGSVGWSGNIVQGIINNIDTRKTHSVCI